MSDHGIPLDQEFVKIGDCHVDSGYSLMQELMSRTPRPSHVFISNYYMHVGASKYLASSGFGNWPQLPERGIGANQSVHIASFDDMTLSHILGFSDLTVAQPMNEIGREAARLILERIDAGNAVGEFRLRRLATRLVPGEKWENGEA